MPKIDVSANADLLPVTTPPTAARAGARGLTRRGVLAGAAATVAVPNEGAVTRVAATDPIFAAIAAHAAAFAEFEAAAHHLCDVEEGVFDHGGQDRGTCAEDDPVLPAAEARFNTADDVQAQAAFALAQAELTGLAAAIVLLRYVADVEADGSEWPEPPKELRGRNWASTFHRNLAVALDRMAS